MLRKIFRHIKQNFSFYIQRKFQFVKKEKIDLLIIDDLMPSSLATWRTYEFNELTKVFKKSDVLCSFISFETYNNGLSYDDSVNLLKNDYNYLAERLRKLKLFTNVNAKVAYVLFFNNCRNYLYYFEKYKIPFVFTLYPGGGFLFNNTEVEETLRKIFQSIYFQNVIVNQYHIKDYLLSNKLCDPSKITLIPGCPVNIDKISTNRELNIKDDICLLFMANRYSNYSFDKGFDLFQLISKYLIDFGITIQCHVIGNFTSSDVHFNDYKKHYIFYGVLNEDEFGSVMNITDFVISPNRPNVLTNGAFDGFPLAASVLAGLQGNIICATDYFDEGIQSGWIDSLNYIKLDLDPYESAKKIKAMLDEKEKLITMRSNSIAKLRNDFCYQTQIVPRINLFKEICK